MVTMSRMMMMLIGINGISHGEIDGFERFDGSQDRRCRIRFVVDAEVCMPWNIYARGD